VQIDAASINTAPINTAPINSVVWAHQGGWDEILLVGAPILIIALLLWLANKRASELHEDGAGSDPDES